MTTLRGGMIGCGFFARHHLEAWKRIPGVQMVAACDIQKERAKACAERAYARPEDMLATEGLDFVDIAARAESHSELVAMAVERRTAIICQKPLAPDWQTALAIVRLAESATVRFMVHENWRWQHWYRRAKEMITAGVIGQPVTYSFRSRHRDGIGENPYPNQPYFRELPRFLIYEALIHYLDTARFLFGEIGSVYADIRKLNPHIAGDDCATILVNHERTAGCIDGHRFLDPDPDGPAMGEAVFEGENGRLLIPATGDIFLNGSIYRKNDVTSGYRGDSVWATQNHFISCLRSGAEFESAGSDYLRTTAAMEAAYRSAAEHRRVPIAEFLEE